jgi:hypothetical protein
MFKKILYKYNYIMSDSSSLNLPISIGMSSDFLLGLKTAAPKSKSNRISISPLNKSVFRGGDQIILEIPTGRRGTWLDQSQSFLKFSIQCQATAAVGVGGSGIYLDNSAYSFISRFDLFHGSNLLETITEYGQLANFLIDTSLTQSDKAGLSPLIGSNPYSTIVSNTAFAAGATFTAASNYQSTVTTLQTAGDRSGLSMAATTAIDGSISYSFAIPLLSGCVGVNASKCLPLGKLNAPLRMELYLESNDNAVYYGTAGAGAIWQMNNVEFVGCFVEIEDSLMDYQVQPGVPE